MTQAGELGDFGGSRWFCLGFWLVIVVIRCAQYDGILWLMFGLDF